MRGKREKVEIIQSSWPTYGEFADLSPLCRAESSQGAALCEIGWQCNRIRRWFVEMIGTRLIKGKHVDENTKAPAHPRFGLQGTAHNEPDPSSKRARGRQSRQSGRIGAELAILHIQEDRRPDMCKCTRFLALFPDRRATEHVPTGYMKETSTRRRSWAVAMRP